MIRSIDTHYWLGDIVYLRMADEPRRGMIACVLARLGGSFIYDVAWGNAQETRHYAEELSREFVPVFTETTTEPIQET